MTPKQIRQRDELLAQSDRLLGRWPNRTGAEFEQGMADVATRLETLAKEADDAQADAMERARTWRYAGNAYFDLGNARAGQRLAQAVEAYERSEELSEDLGDAVETMKLNYSLGHALFGLSDESNLARLIDARRRYVIALEKARAAVPAAVEPAAKSLANVEQVISLLKQSADLSQQIDQLKSSGENSDPEPAGKESEFDPKASFKMLLDQVEAEKQKGTLSEIRESGLNQMMSQLGELVASASDGESLEESIRSRGELGRQMAEALMKARKPTFEGPALDGDGRAARIQSLLMELKTIIGADGIRVGKTDSDHQTVFELYRDLARLNTFVHQTQGDGNKLVELETDQAREVVVKARRYLRRRHITFAHPVWSGGRVMPIPTAMYFSGPAETRSQLAEVGRAIDLHVNLGDYSGADPAEARWHDLCTTILAVFDISDRDPQVFYDLGIALTMGTELLLLSREDELESEPWPPFDVQQGVCFYKPNEDNHKWLAGKLDEALYGVQCKASASSGTESTLMYVERLAAADGKEPQMTAMLQELRSLVADPIGFAAALEVVNGYLELDDHVILYPRWPGVYPNTREKRRCFIIMPFRKKLKKTRETIEQACRNAGVEPCRGDVASGQHVIASIWEEIGRASHVVVDLTEFNLNVCLELGIADALGRPTMLIGRQGTERQMFESIAKRRCHVYKEFPSRELNNGLRRFLGEVASY